VIPSRSSSTARRRVSVSVRVARIGGESITRVGAGFNIAPLARTDFLAVGRCLPTPATLARVTSIVASTGMLAMVGCPTVDVQTLAPQPLTNASPPGTPGVYTTSCRSHRDGDSRNAALSVRRLYQSARCQLTPRG
jgi:hypothetical protein